jgi:hypothetical protein
MPTVSQRTRPYGLFPGQPTPRLCNSVVEALRARHFSRCTEKAYVNWIRRLILFKRSHHPRELAEDDVNRLLSHLAVKAHVAASTQSQALSAILFLHQHVLRQPLDRNEGVVRARNRAKASLRE